MTQKTTFAFTDIEYARMAALAEANFPDRRGKTGGNLTALLSHLIFEAYHKPELFDLQPPNAPANERPTVTEQLAPKKED